MLRQLRPRRRSELQCAAQPELGNEEVFSMRSLSKVCRCRMTGLGIMCERSWMKWTARQNLSSDEQPALVLWLLGVPDPAQT